MQAESRFSVAARINKLKREVIFSDPSKIARVYGNELHVFVAAVTKNMHGIGFIQNYS